MSTYERSEKVTVEGLPDGYEVTYHQIRGYDSPDKWYEVSFKGEKIGKAKTIGYGSKREAVKAAKEHHASGAGSKLSTEGMRHWCDSVEGTFSPRETDQIPRGKVQKQVPEAFLATAIRYLRAAVDEIDELRKHADGDLPTRRQRRRSYPG